MEVLIALLALAAGLASAVCWIWTIVVAFKEGDGPLLGILSICGIVGFIIGWVHHRPWSHTRVMVVWSIAIVAGIVLQVLMAAVAGGSSY